MSPTDASPVTAVCAGTFDPVTRGHEDVLRRSARMFPRVIVAVAAAHHKKTLFSLEERIDMVQLSLSGLSGLSGLTVLPFDGLLTDFVRQQGAQVVVRGVRSHTDFDYESQLAGMNRQLLPAMDTVFLTPGDAVRHISSTLVREIAALGGDVSRFVHPMVLDRLHAKLGRKPG